MAVELYIRVVRVDGTMAEIDSIYQDLTIDYATWYSAPDISAYLLPTTVDFIRLATGAEQIRIDTFARWV